MEPPPSPRVEETKPEPRRQCHGGHCCKHPACASLKEHALCQRWYFLRWVSSWAMMPSEILRELRERLEKREFRFYGTVTGTDVFSVLVRVELGCVPIWACDLAPSAEVTNFSTRESGAWQLVCCWDALQWDVQHWLATVRETDEKTVFGDKRLPLDLVDDVRAVGGREELVY